MRHETVEQIGPFRVVLMDSISLIGPGEEGTIVVCGSHGGAISGAFARRHPPALVVFNDAGFGKRGAGIASLALLEAAGVAAATLSHLSARIGDARDGWDSGTVSRCNAPARAAGVAPGVTVRAGAQAFAEHATPSRSPAR